MKRLLIILLFLLQVSQLFAQQEKRYIHNGNKLYQQKKYKQAEDDYRKSVEKKSKNIEGNFNLGDALYKQKKFAEAGQQFNQLAGSGGNQALKAKAYHNLGNSMLEDKKLQEGIDAYKKALINNPNDDQTRYNLAYAQEKLKQQQKQNQQNKNDKDQSKDQQKKDKKEPKNDQNKKNQNKGNQDHNKKDEQNGQKPQPDKLSKDDAERMLDALNNDEKQTQEKLKNKKLKGERMHITKDW